MNLEIWLLALLLVTQAHTILVNTTVDDTFGDQLTGKKIEYYPVGAWDWGDQCSACEFHHYAQLLGLNCCTGTTDGNRTQVYQHTWHVSTFDPQLGNTDYVTETPSLKFLDFNGGNFWAIRVAVLLNFCY